MISSHPQEWGLTWSRMISTYLFLCWHWVCLRFVSNGSCVVVHVMLDSDAQLAALQSSRERNWYEISHQIAGLSFLQIVKLLFLVFMTITHWMLIFTLIFKSVLFSLWCAADHANAKGLLDFLFPSLTAKHFWTWNYSHEHRIQHFDFECMCSYQSCYYQAFHVVCYWMCPAFWCMCAGWRWENSAPWRSVSRNLVSIQFLAITECSILSCTAILWLAKRLHVVPTSWD
jgi:hypothetical protein